MPYLEVKKRWMDIGNGMLLVKAMLNEVSFVLGVDPDTGRRTVLFIMRTPLEEIYDELPPDTTEEELEAWCLLKQREAARTRPRPLLWDETRRAADTVEIERVALLAREGGPR